MKRKRSTALVVSALAIAASLQATVGSTQAQAVVNYRLKNVATGKCLTATQVAPLPTSLKMRTCGSISTGQTQSFTPAGNYIETGGTGPGILACIAVANAASTEVAFTPVLATCHQSGYKMLTYDAVGTKQLILSGCFLGHYASTDTWAACFNRKGNNTYWNWVRA